MYEILADVEFLTKRYVDERKTLQQIADEVGCAQQTVIRAMKRHGVRRRKHTSKFYLLNDKYSMLFMNFLMKSYVRFWRFVGI